LSIAKHSSSRCLSALARSRCRVLLSKSLSSVKFRSFFLSFSVHLDVLPSSCAN
jgi:hypothetical protein